MSNQNNRLFKVPHRFTPLCLSGAGSVSFSDSFSIGEEDYLLFLREGVNLFRPPWLSTIVEKPLSTTGDWVHLSNFGASIASVSCNFSSTLEGCTHSDILNEADFNYTRDGFIRGSLFLAPNSQKIWLSKYDVRFLVPAE